MTKLLEHRNSVIFRIVVVVYINDKTAFVVNFDFKWIQNTNKHGNKEKLSIY